MMAIIGIIVIEAVTAADISIAAQHGILLFLLFLLPSASHGHPKAGVSESSGSMGPLRLAVVVLWPHSLNPNGDAGWRVVGPPQPLWPPLTLLTPHRPSCPC